MTNHKHQLWHEASACVRQEYRDDIVMDVRNQVHSIVVNSLRLQQWYGMVALIISDLYES